MKSRDQLIADITESVSQSFDSYWPELSDVAHFGSRTDTGGPCVEAVVKYIVELYEAERPQS